MVIPRFGEDIGQESNVSKKVLTVLRFSGTSLIKQLFDPSLLASSSGVLEGNGGQDPAIETWTGDMP